MPEAHVCVKKVVNPISAAKQLIHFLEQVDDFLPVWNHSFMTPALFLLCIENRTGYGARKMYPVNSPWVIIVCLIGMCRFHRNHDKLIGRHFIYDVADRDSAASLRTINKDVLVGPMPPLP